MGFESTLKHCLHYQGPAPLASNSQLNKYGYERRFIDESWWIKPRWRKLAMKYCYSEELRCCIERDVMKWFALPKQVCSLISLLMLPLLPGVISGLLPRSQLDRETKPKEKENINQRDLIEHGDDSVESQNKFGTALLWLCSHAFAGLISGEGQQT